MERNSREVSMNVFAELGLPYPEQLLRKANWANQICRLINEHELTQVQAARLLNIDQPKISAIMCGDFKGLSVDRLSRWAAVLQQRLKPTAKIRAAIDVSRNATVNSLIETSVDFELTTYGSLEFTIPPMLLTGEVERSPYQRAGDL